MIAAILEREPDWSALPADDTRRACAAAAALPREGPEERLRDIGDAVCRILRCDAGGIQAARPARGVAGVGHRRRGRRGIRLAGVAGGATAADSRSPCEERRDAAYPRCRAGDNAGDIEGRPSAGVRVGSRRRHARHLGAADPGWNAPARDRRRGRRFGPGFFARRQPGRVPVRPGGRRDLHRLHAWRRRAAAGRAPGARSKVLAGRYPHRATGRVGFAACRRASETPFTSCRLAAARPAPGGARHAGPLARLCGRPTASRCCFSGEAAMVPSKRRWIGIGRSSTARHRSRRASSRTPSCGVANARRRPGRRKARSFPTAVASAWWRFRRATVSSRDRRRGSRSPPAPTGILR